MTLFVMRPHPNDFHCALLFEHLIDEPMLDVDAARIGSLEVADQLLIGKWILDQLPFHQRRSFAHLETGVFRPFRMDSRMPGMESRYTVS